ncbi:MAG: winged helix-turn-helix domain-containing tetratricopeptide repeat protein, partial [Arenimonas sp.]
TYSFNDIHVDVDGMKVTRAGLEIALEPKAHSLLSVLLSRPGHAFTHQELLDAVWGHRHVTPGVLVRLIGILRRALGDEDSHERYIQTIHGVGYRFNLPAQPDSQDAALPDEIAANDPALPLDIVNGSPEPETQDGVGNDSPVKTARKPGIHYNRQFLQLTVLLFVLLSLWALLYFRKADESKQQTNPADTVPVLAVMPLRALDKDERSRVLAESVSGNIVNLLSLTPGIRVTAPATSMELSKPAGELASKLHASHYLEGTVQHDQQRVFVNLRLVLTSTRRTIWSQSFERQSDPGFLLQQQIARTASKQLKKALQITVTPAGEDPVRYKRYYWALQRITESSKLRNADLQDSEREMRQLTLEYPYYARAWAGLATLYMLSSGNVNKEREKNREQAILAANKALSLDAKQADAMSVLAAFACRDQDWEACLALSEKSVELDPDNPLLLTFHSHRLITVGYVKRGLKVIDDSLAIDPLGNIASFSRGRALDTLGRHLEARDQLLATDLPAATITALYMNAMWRNDFMEAKRIAGELPLDFRWRDSEMTLADAMTDASLWPELMQKLEKSEAQFDSPTPFRPYSLERLFLPKRNYHSDIAGLDVMQTMGYNS